ncbi:hypothetical protein OQA88_12718 [Cercophora sp. LCS_1]
MPATRKSSRQSGAATGRQSTLSFHHRVTKQVPKSAKDISKPSTLSKEIIPEPEPTKIEQTEEVPDVTPEPEVEKSESERKAEKVTSAAIERYWKNIDSSRMARATHRKHTEGLTTGEKILRYFDVSSQYGPCIGTARLKRWQRAEALGLNPPIEVLAVLLKEENKPQRAHMDELMNSTAVGTH